MSPMMRLIPSVTPVATFERTLGRSTRRIVVIRVLPSANAASRRWAGKGLDAVAGRREHGGQREQRHHDPGRDERLPVDASAFRGKEKGANRLSWKIDRPNSAITMSGVPATISMLDSTTRASQLGRPYSAIHTALRDGERDRDRDAR